MPREGSLEEAGRAGQRGPSLAGSFYSLHVVHIGEASAKRRHLLNDCGYRLWNQSDLTLNPDPVT